MAKEKFDRTKPNCNLGILGRNPQNKTELIAAITTLFPASSTPKDPTGITINTDHAEFETVNRHYTIVNSTCSNYTDYIKNMVAGAVKMDAAIFVISATNVLSLQEREHLLAAHQLGLTKIVVFIDNVDKVNNPDTLDLAEMELRQVLSQYGFDGDNAPIIRGSSKGALNDEKKWKDKIVELVNACDQYLPLPLDDKDKPFLLPIEDMFTITGRGTIVTGRVERGTLHITDRVERVGIRENASFIATGIEMFRKQIDEALPGDNIGVLLRGAEKKDFERGMVLAAPGSISAHTHFKADIYMLKKEEGGRHTPVMNGYRPQFYFRTAGFTGTFEIPNGDLIFPGNTVEIAVKLIVPIAMEKGTLFVIREGGRTVATGVVTELLAEDIPEQPTIDETDKPFLMKIEDVFIITGRGLVITGLIESGCIHLNDKIKSVGSNTGNAYPICNIDVLGKSLEEAKPGDNVGLLLRGAPKDEFCPGMKITTA